jgi:hypothetical protein
VLAVLLGFRVVWFLRKQARFVSVAVPSKPPAR